MNFLKKHKNTIFLILFAMILEGIAQYFGFGLFDYIK